MIVMTTNGHCGTIKVGLAISAGKISLTSGKFVMRPIKVAGSVSGSGATKMNAVAGPRKAQGIGRFNGSRAGPDPPASARAFGLPPAPDDTLPGSALLDAGASLRPGRRSRTRVSGHDEEWQRW